jgi:hypothetical protein
LQDTAGKGEKETAALAAILLTVCDGFIISNYGDMARMTQVEKAMIEPPLTRVLGRLDVAANDALNKYLDPVLLALGFLAWGMRINRIAKENTPHKDSPKEPEPARPMQRPEPSRNPDDLGSLTGAPVDVTGLFRAESL